MTTGESNRRIAGSRRGLNTHETVAPAPRDFRFVKCRTIQNRKNKMTPQVTNQRLASDLARVRTERIPGAGVCRAKPAGFGDYVDCLTESSHRCDYALKFGGNYLCLHPDRQRIVEKTKHRPNGAVAVRELGSNQPARARTGRA